MAGLDPGRLRGGATLPRGDALDGAAVRALRPPRALAAWLAMAALPWWATTTHAAPDLTLAKTHAGSFVAGSNGTYTLVVRNVGATSSLGVTTVVDTLPAGLTYVAGNGFGWSFSTSGP